MKTGITILILCLSLVNRCYTQDSIPLTLNRLFTIADSNSRKLRLDKINLEYIAAREEVIKSQRLPAMDLSIAAGYLSDVGVIGLKEMNNGFYDMPHLSNSLVLQASYLIFDNGKIKNELKVAALDSKIATLTLKADQQDIRLLLTAYFLDLYRIKLQQTVLRRNIQQASLLLEKITNRQQAGIALKSDRIRSELFVEEMRLQLLKLNNRAVMLNNSLVETLAMPYNTVIVPQVDAIDSMSQPFTLEFWLNKAVMTDPLLKRSSVAITKTELKSDILRSENLPNASLYLSNGFVRPYVYDIPARDIYANNFNVGIRLNYNIGNLYKNKVRIREIRKETELAQASHEISLEKSRTSVFNAFVLFTESREQVATERKKLELATENYRRIFNSYDQQLALITDMTDASNQRLEAEMQLANAQVQIIMRYYELKKSAGNLE